MEGGRRGGREKGEDKVREGREGKEEVGSGGREEARERWWRRKREVGGEVRMFQFETEKGSGQIRKEQFSRLRC